MTLRIQGFAVIASALLATSSFAQTSFPEVEPNSVKAEATAVTGIVAGDSITGTTTGTTTTAGSTLLTTVDTFRVKTGPLPLGIYKNTLTITSAVVGHTGSIRGLNQTGTTGTASTGGTPGTTDSAVQTSSTTSVNPPPRSNQWYGFGKQEELYYRVTGGTATTAAYAATLSTSTVPFTVIAPAFEGTSSITISSIGETTADTEFKVYDSAFNALAGFDNDDEGPAGATLQSRLTRSYAPGVYYLAVGNSNTAWNFPSPPDEDFFSLLMDFPNVVVCASTLPTTTTADRDFVIRACNGGVAQSNQVTAPDSYSIQWFQFTVANGAPLIGPPANDNCASAIAFTASGSHTTRLATATNDGSASCDPGGAGSKDVWYSFNGGSNGGTLAINTCGTTLDTAVSVYNSCGGAEIACNDDCGGAPCAGTSSCLSGVAVGVGQVVLVRVSDKGLGGCGELTTTFTFVANPPPNDACGSPLAIGPGSQLINTTLATTGAEGQTEALCLNAASTAIFKDVWYAFTPTKNSTVTVTTCGLLTGSPSLDSRIAIYSGTACPAAGTAIACNDDDAACGASTLNSTVSFSAVCGTQYLIQIGAFGSTGSIVGSFSVTEGAGTSCSVGTPECIGDTAAACPCSGSGGTGIPNPGAPGNGCGNSSFPAGANLSASGNAVDNAGDTLVLTCTNMPGPGMFIQSNALAGPFINFNDGVLCAAVGIIRLGVVFPTGGTASYPGGLTPAPIHVAGAPVLVGGSPTPETKHYQCWYRDITVGFCNPQGHNMSNGLAIVWAP